MYLNRLTKKYKNAVIMEIIATNIKISTKVYPFFMEMNLLYNFAFVKLLV
jgi:hypothetical protein